MGKQRMTVFLPPEEVKELKKEALERGLYLSDLVSLYVGKSRKSPEPVVENQPIENKIFYKKSMLKTSSGKSLGIPKYELCSICHINKEVCRHAAQTI